MPAPDRLEDCPTKKQSLLQIVWKVFAVFSDLREHAGKDLKAQVLLIAHAIGAALKDADFVVETLDEAEGDLVVGTAIGGDAVPVTSRVRLSRCDSKVYFWPLMTLRSLPRSRAYSLFLTWSKASPRWRMTWNLSNRMLACLRVELRKGFHMSITTSRTRLLFAAPSHW